jgi:putative transcriptional regulator
MDFRGWADFLRGIGIPMMLRKATKLSQEKFAALLRVEVSTLRNWEQGRREPTGPAKALLYTIRKDPTHVLKALAA